MLTFLVVSIAPKQVTSNMSAHLIAKVYWSDVPSDVFVSSFQDVRVCEMYLSIETDSRS